MSAPCPLNVLDLDAWEESEESPRRPVSRFLPRRPATGVALYRRLLLPAQHPNAPDDNLFGPLDIKVIDDILAGNWNPAFVADEGLQGKEWTRRREGTSGAVGEEVVLREGASLPSSLQLIQRQLHSAGDTASCYSDSWATLQKGSFVAQKIQFLVEAFAQRAHQIKTRIAQPATPSPSPSPEPEAPDVRPRLESLIQHDDLPPAFKTWPEYEGASRLARWAYCIRRRCTFPSVIDPQSRLYISWLLLVTVCYLYNAWFVFLRAIFPYGSPDLMPLFFTFDYVCDLIYLVDALLFKPRLQFLNEGLWEERFSETKKNYFQKSMFKMDVLSLLPLDLLYFQFGVNTLLRFPRLLKIQTFWEFFMRVDAVAKTPYIIRIIHTLIYMMFLIHLNACAYYAMSAYEGIGSNGWVFKGDGNAYIRCFYFATKTATSIGKNPKPENEVEYVFMTASWLMGVFVFAFLIGQIRDIVATATRSKTHYRHLMDGTVRYLRALNLPDELQRRVRLWLNRTWEQQKTFDESAILDSLPIKMKTDVALSVHYHTLMKVQMFKDCERSFIRDLVLKLRPIMFLPGDFICKKGEIGKEMYIVSNGQIHVMGGDKADKVLATLAEGSVFGEISLLGIEGYRRRTADVRSKGYASLFVLKKEDLWDALRTYPEAENILKKKARSLIKINTEREQAEKIRAEAVIDAERRRVSTPRLIKTVMQVVDPESRCAQMLLKGSSVNRLSSFSYLPGRCSLDASLSQRSATEETSFTIQQQHRRRTSPDVSPRLPQERKLIELTSSNRHVQQGAEGIAEKKKDLKPSNLPPLPTSGRPHTTPSAERLKRESVPIVPTGPVHPIRPGSSLTSSLISIRSLFQSPPAGGKPYDPEEPGPVRKGSEPGPARKGSGPVVRTGSGYKRADGNELRGRAVESRIVSGSGSGSGSRCEPFSRIDSGGSFRAGPGPSDLGPSFPVLGAGFRAEPVVTRLEPWSGSGLDQSANVPKPDGRNIYEDRDVRTEEGTGSRSGAGPVQQALDNVSCWSGYDNLSFLPGDFAPGSRRSSVFSEISF